MTTEFDLLEGQGGRLFLYIHTGMTAYTLELDHEDDDLDRLQERLAGPPISIDGPRKM